MVTVVPSYGLQPFQVNPFKEPEKAPGFLREVAGNVKLSAPVQVAFDTAEYLAFEEEPDFNPYDHLDGYHLYADRLLLARSRGQMNAMKSRIDSNNDTRQELARGEWGIIAGITAGLFDPINYVPIPGVAGMGFVRGAIVAGASNMALSAATEPLRINADPTADWSELQYSVAAAGLLGAGLGGIAGSFRPRGVRATGSGRASRPGRSPVTMNDVWEAVSIDEGDNFARTFNAQDEEISRIFGKTNQYEASGRYKPVSFENVDVPEATKTGIDGQTYRYDEALGWVNNNTPDRPIGDDVRDALGMPNMVSAQRMIVDDVALKVDYERSRWIDDLPEDRRVEAQRLIRNQDEYLTFRQLEAVWGNRLTAQPNEPSDLFRTRVQEQALNELQARRVSSATARSNLIGAIADRANMSPTAKAIRLFRNDTLMTDLPLQIAGDGGWMTQANRAGLAPTPSVFLKTLRHQVKIAEMRQAVDAAFLKHVTGNADVKGRMLAGQNMSAALASVEARVKRLRGGNVLTMPDFRQMVGRAIFENDDFEVNGFKVLPEAREAAAVITKVFKEYDDIQRELGLFYDQKGLKRTVQESDRRIIDLKDQMTRWLWNGKDAPQRVNPAIRVDGKVYEGATYQDAINALLNQRGADGRAALEQLTTADYGYTRAGTQKLPGKNTQIIGAAVKIGDQVFYDLNHFEALRRASDELGRPLDDLIADSDAILDGFATNDGLFASRDEATDIARNAKQIDDPDIEGRPIMTEDLSGWTKVDLKSGSFKIELSDGQFTGQSDLIASRVDSLTDRQRAVYDDMATQLARLEQERTAAADALQQAVDDPHVFFDQAGRQEGYFSRWFNETEILANRPQFERLITSIFARDNPLGAAERAKSFVDDMLSQADTADEGAPMGGNVRHLHQRKLKVGNSYKIDDPELGEIRMSDFIETDAEVVFDTYVRRAGARIEMARQFGDPDLWGTLHDMEIHWREKTMKPDMSPDEIRLARAAFDEWKGQIELSRDDVLGRLKTAPPWRRDNAIARHLRDIGNFVRLPKVLLTTIPELARGPMVNGFGRAYKSVFMRAFATLEQVDRTSKDMKLTGEILEMVLPHGAARLNDLNSAAVSRGSAYTRAISQHLPTFFKINGLTPTTVIHKEIVQMQTMHRVLEDAAEIAKALNSGQPPDATLVARQAADGISLRDNLLLAKMPIERTGNGLILAATQNWAGNEGRRATNLLVNAMQVTARRAVVTPGPADLPLIARGVFTWKGRKVFESDLMGLLFAFKGYGMAAMQKVVLSGMQGRDVNFSAGIVSMLMLGALTVYIKTPELAWRNKSYEEIMLEAYEASGIGGFIFSDLNGMIETYSAQQLGMRPMLGLDPRMGNQGALGKYVDMMGPGASVYGQVVQAFIDPDPELTMSNRAQMIRRSIPYANFYFIDGLTRNLVSSGVEAFEE